MRKVLEEWGKQEIFPSEILQAIKVENKKSVRPTFAQSPNDVISPNICLEFLLE